MKDIPAFPRDNSLPDWSGMTLRDYFAAKALEGICASQQTKLFTDQDHLAKGAYLLADAMMKARTDGL
jgi:hypothetical protein